MSNKPSDDRARRKPPRRHGSGEQQQRPRGGQGGGGGGGGGERHQHQQQGGRLSREQIEWARDLWNHHEPPDEIAQQLGVDIAQIDALIASWSRQ